MRTLLAAWFILSVYFISCNTKKEKQVTSNKIFTTSNLPLPKFDSSIHTIAQIPLPVGFKRVFTAKGSMEHWLQNLELKKDNRLHLYNKQLSKHQSWHYAILDISVPENGLQQCADAVMRLKAEYLFNSQNLEEIKFLHQKQWLHFTHLNCFTYECFLNFMNQVFANCGSYNLQASTKNIQRFNDINIGNILVVGGSPGHAMIVVDVAENEVTKQKIYLLAQSYLPSEEVHIVINTNNKRLSPWYLVDSSNIIVTPGYQFKKEHLRKW